MTPLRAYSVRRVVPAFPANGPLLAVRHGGNGTVQNFTESQNFFNSLTSYDLVTQWGTTLASWIGANTAYVVTWCVTCCARRAWHFCSRLCFLRLPLPLLPFGS